MTDPILEREPKLAEAVRRLVAAYQPERMYLLGSAREGRQRAGQRLHDPVGVADARAGLAKADMDLRAAVHELTATPPFTADAVFPGRSRR